MHKGVMGRRQLFWGTALAVLLTLAGAGNACAGSMIAAPYPGAVPDRHAGDVTVRVYLSKAPLAKVVAWYAAKVGSLDKEAGNTLWNTDGGGVNVGRPLGATNSRLEVRRLGRVMLGQAMVARSLKDMTQAKVVGVYCAGIAAQPESTGTTDGQADAGTAGMADATSQALAKMQQQMQQLNRQLMAQTTPEDRALARMSDLFEGLRQEVDSGLHGHSKKELLAVYARYKNLETAWFPTVKTPKGPESYDRWLLARKRAQLMGEQQDAAAPAAQGGADMAALASRLQAAAAAGRMDEVRALSSQMQQSMQGGEATAAGAGKVMTRDHWSFWIGFLKTLEAKAYRTRIWINTQPSSWGY